MRSEITRLMVEVAVSQGLRDLKQESHRRALRNLVEHGGRYSRGPFQRALFEMFQDMLRSDSHPYYALVSRAARDVDEKYFMDFCINMGFDSWTQGARLIRKEEAAEGCDTPWCISMTLSEDSGRALPSETVCRLMDQGIARGVLCYLLLDAQARRETLQMLSEQYPRCPLVVFVPDDKVDDVLLDALEGATNLMLVPTARGGFTAVPRLRARRRLYGLCTVYDEEQAQRLLTTEDVSVPEDPDCLLPMYQPDSRVSETTKAAVSDLLNRLKRTPTRPLLPLDLDRDLQRIDCIISTDDSTLSVDVDGQFRIGRERAASGLYFPSCSLNEVIHACLKKHRAEGRDKGRNL